MQGIQDKSVGGEVYTAVLVPPFRCVAFLRVDLFLRAYVRKIYVRK